MKTSKIRVLVVDDSAVVRTLMTHILESDPGIEVVGTAPDPYIARDKLVALRPDVMTLDIEMPRMDGLTFLDKVMTHLPVPTIVISSLTVARSEHLLKALELGAVDVVAKPTMDLSQSLNEMGADLISRVKAASRARVSIRRPTGSPATTGPSPASPSPSIHAVPVTPLKTKPIGMSSSQILAFAASTGGTEALKVVLKNLPAGIPGTVIVQHMPPLFTKSYAEALNRMCAFEVREAKDGDRVQPGLVLLAPGDYHMVMVRSGGQYFVKLNQEPLMHGVRPAADHLLRSVAELARGNAIGVILTGMGRDGADGLLAMRKAGAFTVAQDEESCIVYGMPKVAAEIGAASRITPLDRIAGLITAQFKKNAA